MTSQESGDSTGLRDKAYRGPAAQWLVQVFVVGVVATILNLLVVSSGSVAGLLLVFLVNLAATVVGVFLLFRNVDTLVLQRIAEVNRQ